MTTKRKAQREREAAEIAEFYNPWVIETEGETIGEESSAPEVPDTSAADAAATQNALAIIPIKYTVDEDAIGKIRKRSEGIDFSNPEGYETGRKILQILRGWTGLTERTRKTLKAPTLERGDRIDERANEIKGWINEIRDPLQAAKDTEDAAREKRRRAAEDAEREAIRLAEEAKLTAEREAVAAERRAFEETQARVAEEQRVAREAAEAQQAEERRLFDAQRRELAEAQAKLEADRQAVAEASAELARFQDETAAQIATFVKSVNAPAPAQIEPVTQAEIDTALAENATTIPPVRVDWVSPPALAGEAEAIATFARQIRALKSPAVTSDLAGALIEQVESMLVEAAEALESFEVQEAATAAE